MNLCDFIFWGEEEPYITPEVPFFEERRNLTPEVPFLEERRNLTPEVPFFFVDAELLCIIRPQQTLKYFVNSLHKHNRPMENVPTHTAWPNTFAWRVSKSAVGHLWGGPGGRSLAAFPPANTSSPAQNPKGPSFDQ